MDVYDQLMTLARRRRDADLEQVRADYRLAVRKIGELQFLLGNQPQAPKPKLSKPLLEVICDMMPKDRPFTFSEVIAAIAKAEPDRPLNESSIRTLLPRLADQGIIRRVGKNQAGRVEWAAAGTVTADNPYGAMALTEVAEIVLREHGPMTPAELVVNIRESGYRADADPRRMVASLRQSVRRYPGRFEVGDDGRWSALASANSEADFVESTG
jgi:hypothetical protein